MSSIANLSEKANALFEDVLASGGVSPSGTPGVSQFVAANGETVLVSADANIVLGDGETHGMLLNAPDARAAGDGADANITGNSLSNLMVGNDGNNILSAGAGNDQVSTGYGDDEVILGDGDDTAVVDGLGTKTIDGGAGSDTFVIEATGEGSHTTLTGLTAGDKLRLYADANKDGQIDINDVDLDKTIEEDGNTTLVLVDGTTVVLEGVVGLFGNANFEVGDDEDGLFVDIS